MLTKPALQQGHELSCCPTEVREISKRWRCPRNSTPEPLIVYQEKIWR